MRSIVQPSAKAMVFLLDYYDLPFRVSSYTNKRMFSHIPDRVISIRVSQKGQARYPYLNPIYRLRALYGNPISQLKRNVLDNNLGIFVTSKAYPEKGV